METKMKKLEFEGIYLTPLQKKMQLGIDWIIVNTGRAQGKTTVMCVSFLKLAYGNIGKWYKVYDHHAEGNNNYMFGMIEGLFDTIKDNKMYRLDINDSESKIRVRYATNEEIAEAKERRMK